MLELERGSLWILMVIEQWAFMLLKVLCESRFSSSLIDESLWILFLAVLVVSIYVLQYTFAMLQYLMPALYATASFAKSTSKIGI